MNIGRRLGLGFGGILLFSILLTSLCVIRLHKIADATSELMQNPLTKERLISDLYRNIDSAVRRTIAVAKSSDSSLATYFATEAAASAKNSSELLKRVETLLSTEQENAQ